MKKTVYRFALLLALASLLVGCEMLAGLFNPLLGVWKYKDANMDITLEILRTNDFEMVMMMGTEEHKAIGTWSSKDAVNITLNVATYYRGGVLQSSGYMTSITGALSADKKTLTLQGDVSIPMTKEGASYPVVGTWRYTNLDQDYTLTARIDNTFHLIAIEGTDEHIYDGTWASTNGVDFTLTITAYSLNGEEQSNFETSGSATLSADGKTLTLHGPNADIPLTAN